MADVLCPVRVRVPPLFQDVLHIAVGQKVYSFGGTRTDRYLSVYVFNTVSLKWTRVFPRDDTCYKDNREVPCTRWKHNGVLIDNVIYIWGGQKNFAKFYDVLYAFDVDTHTWINVEVSGTVPEARSDHSACVSGKVMYIHGGDTKTGCTNDVYKLDTSTMVWSVINTRGTAPPVSSGHSATTIGTKMFVFGGLWKEPDYNSIRVFDTETNHWLSTPSAQPLPMQGRYCHSAFAYNGELYICGTEYDDDNVESENGLPMTIRNLWRINPETFSWKKIKPKPKGNRLFTMVEESCCCVVGDCVVMFGYDAAGGGVFAYILDFSPSLQTLCELSVLQYGLDQSELPHNIREELAAMTMTDDHTPPAETLHGGSHAR